jgi:hypothetical protein
LIAETAGAGKSLYQAVLKKMTAPIENPRFIFEIGACFVAGTLVHTDKGLVPIEQIKVGDLVLSKPENGEGEPAYKPVVNTFVHHDKRIARINYMLNDDPCILYPVISTWEHPFWVIGEGWTAASQLRGPWLTEHKLELFSGANATVYMNRPIYRTKQLGVGWFGDKDSGEGAEYDFINMKGISSDALLDYDIEESDDPYLKTTVYNFEVADYHTYYVGEHGVWVHNADCSGINLRVNDGVTVLGVRPADSTLSFESQQALAGYIRDNNLRDSFVVLKSPGADEYALLNPIDIKKWLKYEDRVVGRLDQDGIRYEYAVIFKNEDGGLTRDFIKVEGRDVRPSGTNLFVDRKLALPNLNYDENKQKVLNMLWRVTQVLEQNPDYRWAFEFETRLNGDERAAFIKAKKFIYDIINTDVNDTNGLKIGKYKYDLQTDKDVFIEDPNSADKLARIRKMLGTSQKDAQGNITIDGGKIEFRDDNDPSIFSQNGGVNNFV